MRFASKLIVTFLLAAFGEAIAAASSFSNSDLSPFLRIHAWRKYGDLNGNRYFDDRNYFITRGGGFVGVEATSANDSDFRNRFIRGAGTSAQLTELRNRLTQGQIGQFKSCEIDTQGSLFGNYEITWYGRNGRRNSFVIVSGPAGASGLPVCPPTADRFIEAILRYQVAVEQRPGTEVLFR